MTHEAIKQYAKVAVSLSMHSPIALLHGTLDHRSLLLVLLSLFALAHQVHGDMFDETHLSEWETWAKNVPRTPEDVTPDMLPVRMPI